MRDIFLDREDKGIYFVAIKNLTLASSLLRSAIVLSQCIPSITRSGARFTISGGSVASDLSKYTSMLIVHPCQPWRIRGQQHADRHRYDAALIRLPFLKPQLIIAWARQNQSRTNPPLDNPHLVSIFPGASNSWHSAVLKQPGCPTPEGTCGHRRRSLRSSISGGLRDLHAVVRPLGGVLCRGAPHQRGPRNWRAS